MLKPRYPVVLASASPRRRQLLMKVVGTYSFDAADLDEEALTCSDPWKTAERLATAKAEVVAARHPEALVVAGDTVVALPSDRTFTLLGKPSDPEDAVRLLQELMGRTHVVVTGIGLVWPGGSACFSETSQVTFRAASETEIRAYVATGEPMDKAGAYGIQDAQHDFCTQIEGSVNNVIGLPVERLLEEILRLELAAE